MNEPSENMTHSSHTTGQEVVEQIAKAAPAVAGTWWTTATPDAQIAAIVGVCTVIYIIAQLFFLLRKWWILELRGWSKDGGKTDTGSTMS
jgi:hypothetical protein